MAENNQESVAQAPVEQPKKDIAATAPSGDPHIDCWHWKAELDADQNATAVCCFNNSHTVTVSLDNPFLRGEHGPYAI
jgi:hypothetical protein